MEEIRATLEALGRTHLALALTSIAVLLLAIPSGPEYQEALDQLRVVQSLFEEDYPQRCADLATQHYGELWSEMQNSHGPIAGWLEDGRSLGGFAYCETPTANTSLSELIELFTERERAQYATITPDALLAALGTFASNEGLNLEAASILPASGPPFTDVTVDSGSRNLAIAVIDPAWPFEDGSDSLQLVLTLDMPGRSATVYYPLTGGISSYRMGDGRLLDWVANASSGVIGMSERVGNPVIMPDVQPFWAEVGGLSLGEATRYLQARAEEQQGSVEVLGMSIDTSMVIWGGPVVILALLAHLLAHLQLLARLSKRDEAPLTSYPWIALLPGGPAMLLRLSTLLVIPVAACGVGATRAWPALPLAAAWSALGAVAACWFGATILLSVARLRQPTTAPP